MTLPGIAGAVLLLVSAVAVWRVSDAVVITTRQVAGEIRQTRDDLHAVVLQAKRDLIEQIDLARRDANGQLNRTRTDLNAQLDQTRTALVTELENVTTKADQRLGEVSASTKTLTEQTGQVAEDFHLVVERGLEREPMVYSRFLATTGELNRTLDAGRRMAEETAKATPELEASAQVIASNSATITANVVEMTRPKSWWRMLLPAIGGAAAKLLVP